MIKRNLHIIILGAALIISIFMLSGCSYFGHSKEGGLDISCDNCRLQYKRDISLKDRDFTIKH